MLCPCVPLSSAGSPPGVGRPVACLGVCDVASAWTVGSLCGDDADGVGAAGDVTGGGVAGDADGDRAAGGANGEGAAGDAPAMVPSVMPMVRVLPVMCQVMARLPMLLVRVLLVAQWVTCCR